MATTSLNIIVTPGLHPVNRSSDLPVRANFSLREIDQVVFLSVLILQNSAPLPPASQLSYRVCERIATNGATPQYRVTTEFELTDRTGEVCSTFTTELRHNDLLYELQLDLKIGAEPEVGKCYYLVVTTEECENLVQTEITLQCNASLEGGETEYISTEFTVCNGRSV